MKYLLIIGFVILGINQTLNAQNKPFYQEREIYSAGMDGVNIFRIPTAITLPSGTVLAFSEAREGGDKTPTDLILRRSTDHGETWSKIETVLYGQGGAIMNPTPVVDEAGTLWMFVNYLRKEVGYDRLWVIKSTDEGKTWSHPVDLTPELGPIHPGPATGLQMKNGRIIIPGRAQDEDTQSLVIYSDDKGETWKLGGNVIPKTNESQAVELADGSLMINMRSERGKGVRAVGISKDGGETWIETYDDPALIDPICQGTIIRYSLADNAGKNRILFANPAQKEPWNRTKMTVKMSYDEGKTWPISRTIYTGPSAYSSLTVMKDGTIGLLYEAGSNSPYESIRFARFNLEWLAEGKDELPVSHE